MTRPNGVIQLYPLVRIALMATHTHEQVDRAVAALVGVFRKLEILK